METRHLVVFISKGVSKGISMGISKGKRMFVLKTVLTSS